MKLNKREITLNEADSLKDVLFLERTIAEYYAEGVSSFRKETANETARLEGETREEIILVERLWKDAKEAQL